MEGLGSLIEQLQALVYQVDHVRGYPHERGNSLIDQLKCMVTHVAEGGYGPCGTGPSVADGPPQSSYPAQCPPVRSPPTYPSTPSCPPPAYPCPPSCAPPTYPCPSPSCPPPTYPCLPSCMPPPQCCYMPPYCYVPTAGSSDPNQPQYVMPYCYYYCPQK